MKICLTEDIEPSELSSCVNPAVIQRECREIEPNQRGGQRKYDNNRNKNYNNNQKRGDYNNMNRPDQKRNYNNNYNQD